MMEGGCPLWAPNPSLEPKSVALHYCARTEFTSSISCRPPSALNHAYNGPQAPAAGKAFFMFVGHQKAGLDVIPYEAGPSVPPT